MGGAACEGMLVLSVNETFIRGSCTLALMNIHSD